MFSTAQTLVNLWPRMNPVAEYAVRVRRHVSKFVPAVCATHKIVLSEAGKLYCPCRCAGSIKWIHGSCAKQGLCVRMALIGL